MKKNLVIAVPKGRILEELEPILQKVGIQPDPSFYDDKDRALQFSTNQPHIELIRVRSFDAATFVAFGAAQLGVVGSDVLEEFDYPDLLAPLDLGIGKCRLSVAEPEVGAAAMRSTHMRVAAKYPRLTQAYFANQGIQAECIKLSGAMELAPKVGLAQRIVDLVSTGSTLKANGLKETEVIMQVSSRLVVNRTAFKTQAELVQPLIEKFKGACHAHHS